MNDTSIYNTVLRAIANKMLVMQYNVSVEHFDLYSTLVYDIDNRNVFALFCLFSGHHVYRERFAERGLFHKIPAVIRDYVSAISVKIDEQARYQPCIASNHDILTCGISSLTPDIWQEPLAVQ